jgi:hypothetical protein
MKLSDRVEALVPFAGYYVSATGEVWSDKRGKLRRLEPTFTPKGYAKLCLILDGERKTCRVHRLICEAFHGPPPNAGDLARHLDGNPKNNNASNLAWGTHSQNSIDALRHGTQTGAVNSKASSAKRRGSLNANAKLQEEQVKQVKRLLNQGEGQSAIAVTFGVSKHAIHLIAKGKSWAHVKPLSAQGGCDGR